MKYNWHLPGWPEFEYDIKDVEDTLFAFAEEVGHMTGVLKAMPEDKQMEAVIDVMVAEAIKTSEIEGEYLNRPDVMSSILNNLGIDQKQEKIKDKKSEGAGRLMVSVRQTFAKPLSEKILFEWHKMLLGENSRITIGDWRRHEDAMQVISGSIGKEKIHFEAPPSTIVPKEMKKFIQWFNDTAPGAKKEIKKAPIRSAIAHLYFETIHPFEDGNGRIGRAIAEKALSQTIGRPILLSLSQTIEADKKTYYAALSKAQKTIEVTSWVNYFVRMVYESQLQAKKLVEFTLKKARFFDDHKEALNERQIKAIRKMLEAGPIGFKGGMTAQKYISITKASKATATRDLQALHDLKIILSEGGGRSTRYTLNIGS